MPVAGEPAKQSHVLAPARTRRVVSEWSDWYVYRIDAPPMGPLSAKAVAEAILAGALPPDCWVCAPGGSRWLRATTVPVIAGLLEGVPTRRHASGTRMVTSPMPSSPTVATARPPMDSALPRKLDETVRVENESDPEVSPEPPTMRSGRPRGPDGFPIPAPPPSSSSPPPPSGRRGGRDTLESPVDESSRKKTLGG